MEAVIGVGHFVLQYCIASRRGERQVETGEERLQAGAFHPNDPGGGEETGQIAVRHPQDQIGKQGLGERFV